MIISIVSIIVGTLLCFIGKKIFKITLFIAGFISLAAVSYYIMHVIEHKYSSIHLTKIESIAIPLAVGFVGGCLVLGVVKIGFFLSGAAVGAIISFMIFSVVGNHFGEHANIIRLVILCVLALICGAVVVRQKKKLIILISSVGGSYAAFAGADHFVKSGYVEAMRGIFLDDKDPLPGGSLHLYIMLGGTILVAVAGIIFQTLTDRKKKKTGWDEDDYLLSRGKVNY